ncbi:diphosphomevalonate decarboxylase-like [Clytia hemisphaerica]|uniref:diphosphomevalonate decarboxylase-like n=1 Tax=Clytia hemisphaerica TaxID=252671 RepID=UPI0034D75946
MKKSVTCIAPINIAVIKYWGKSDESLNIPLNSSLSITLATEDLCTETQVSFDDSLGSDELWLNGKQEDITLNKRIIRVLKEVRKIFFEQNNNKSFEKDISKLPIKISSVNNFPTAAGLASSASGYACLAKCLGKLFDLRIKLSYLARLGSGSASRSIDGGFVKWMKGNCLKGTDSVAHQIATENHWEDLKCVILVVSNKQKSVPSTQGMRNSVETSELLKLRVQNIVEPRLAAMEQAIKDKNFENFAALTMKDSNQLHAICQDTYPPITPPYLNATSHKIIKLITDYNKNGIKAAYTFDAGANAFLFTLKESLHELLATLFKYFPMEEGCINLLTEELKKIDGKSCNLDEITPSHNAIERIILTKPGKGATVIMSEDFS